MASPVVFVLGRVSLPRMFVFFRGPLLDREKDFLCSDVRIVFVGFWLPDRQHLFVCKLDFLVKPDDNYIRFAKSALCLNYNTRSGYFRTRLYVSSFNSSNDIRGLEVLLDPINTFDG
jgi:hypothetical protein